MFHPRHETYVFRDKYFGRKLDPQGFGTALKEYFFNGVYLRVDVIAFLLNRLTAFREVLARPRTYQFRSSSLLFVYEGKLVEPITNNGPDKRSDVESPAPPAFADVRLIDFAHTDKLETPEVDTGVLFGLDNLLATLRRLLEEDPTGALSAAQFAATPTSPLPPSTAPPPAFSASS